MKKFIPFIVIILLVLALLGISRIQGVKDYVPQVGISQTKDGQEIKITHPLQIEVMRNEEYPGSDIVIQEKLPDGNGFERYIASYTSDGNSINGLLAIPKGDAPAGGWPAVVFNHGYIQPEVYRREQKYVAYVAGFASNGYVVFMSDYRGHQDSEGQPLGAYFSPAYTTDVLNAYESLKKYPNVNPDKVGMWGHSMGGHIVLRSMVVNPDIKVGVIWGGVVASYEDMVTRWNRNRPWRPSERENMSHRPGRGNLEEEYGDISANADFWQSISPIYFVEDISGPIQIHHGLSDETVPWQFSESLYNALTEADKEVEYYTYEGGDHNLSGSSFSPAMQRSVEYFDKYLKGE